MDAAESAGFCVLHALVDSLYVTRCGEGETSREEFERLAEEIERRTGLPIAIEDVYRYVVFLPSKQSAEIPVPNRFFCVPESGEPLLLDHLAGAIRWASGLEAGDCPAGR